MKHATSRFHEKKQILTNEMKKIADKMSPQPKFGFTETQERSFGGFGWWVFKVQSIRNRKSIRDLNKKRHEKRNKCIV